ncbi:MAG TPA: hypothetical protein PLP19_17035 [bacterium]|nr:hypothetical protein [bacterium]HPN45200.1 hypothetical protein [bacterium]
MKKSELPIYVKMIFQKWIFWLFLILDIGGALAQFLIPKFSLPTNVYGILAIIGIFWAGYQVYKESVESYRLKLERISSELNIDSILKIAKINICFIEGREYSYYLINQKYRQTLIKDFDSNEQLITKGMKNNKIQNSENKKSEYSIPSATIVMNFRIENTGCALDVLVIGMKCERDFELPFDLYGQKVTSIQGNEIKYPKHMKSDTNLECKLQVKITPISYHTMAQFASRIKDLREIESKSKVIIWLEAVDGTGKRIKFSLDTSVSFRPLIDLYISHWLDCDQKELIRLAGGIT